MVSERFTDAEGHNRKDADGVENVNSEESGYCRYCRYCVYLGLCIRARFCCGRGKVSLDIPDISRIKQLAPIALERLPRQGRITYALIHQGGPFPYDKDGTVFGNRERLLPAQKRGYYREYTVGTPGARNRGARRIVCGGKPIAPSVCYYTADHYNSFRTIAP